MGGVRCSNCGTTPGIPVQTLADLVAPRVEKVEAGSQYVPVPMEIAPKSGAPTRRRSGAAERRKTAAPKRPAPIAETAEEAPPGAQSVAVAEPAVVQASEPEATAPAPALWMGEAALAILAYGRRLAEDLPQFSGRILITGGAACVAIAMALAVVLALG